MFQTVATANVGESVGDNGLSWFALGLGLVLAVTGITGRYRCNTTGSAIVGQNGDILNLYKVLTIKLIS